MVTGGFKTRDQAIDAVVSGKTDIVGLARSLVLDPNLPRSWQASDFPRSGDITFPRFDAPPEGGITAWYTMRMTELGQDSEGQDVDLPAAVKAYNERDAERTLLWRRRFGSGAGSRPWFCAGCRIRAAEIFNRARTQHRQM